MYVFNKPLNFLSLFLHLRLAKPTVFICFYCLPVSSSELGEPNAAGTGDEFGPPDLQYNGAQFSGTSWVFQFSAPTRHCVTVFHDLALDAFWFYHILSVQLFQKLLRLELHWKTWKNKRELLILKEDYLSFYRSTKRNSSGAWKDYYRPEWSSNFDRNTSRSMASRPSPDASWTWPTETYCRNQTLPNHCPCHGVWSPV